MGRFVSVELSWSLLGKPPSQEFLLLMTSRAKECNFSSLVVVLTQSNKHPLVPSVIINLHCLVIHKEERQTKKLLF